MTELVPPDVRLQPSWAEAVAEFVAAGSTQHGYGLWDFEPLETTEAGCRAAVEFLLAQADPATELPEGLVHCTYFWITEDDTFVGYLAIRHSLTPRLLEEGGHIGYSVRPSRRSRGHASRARALAVRRAREQLGRERVLVTCDDNNEASRRTIERCGGVFEDERQGRLRYWI